MSSEDTNNSTLNQSDNQSLNADSSPINPPTTATAIESDAKSNENLSSSSTSLPTDFLATQVPLPQPPENPANTVPSKTLWMGDLEAWWDEAFITGLWLSFDKHVGVKVIKPKHNLLMHQLAKTNGQGIVNHSGYCFVEFDSPELATDALSLNGKIIPNTNNKTFRLNWASAATLDSEIAQTPEFSLFVGDLSATTTEAHLLSLFQSSFSSIKTVRVMTDPSSGLSRCFGFVRFSNDDDRKRALVEMNGSWLGGRQIRVALASPKHQQLNNNYNNYNNHHHNNNSYHNYDNNHSQSDQNNMFSNNSNNGQGGYYQSSRNSSNNINNDPNNTTVFVGGLAHGLYEDALYALFEPFGEIKTIKVPPGKGCGFVKFSNRIDAERAIEGMQGFIIGGSRVRLSWGRPSSKNIMRQSQNHPNNFNNSNLNIHPHHYTQYLNNVSGGNLPSQGCNDNFNDTNIINQVPTMTMFNGQPLPPTPTQQQIPIPMFDYGQSGGQIMSPSPQQLVDNYGNRDPGTPQGQHLPVVGVPPGMPPPFIYDPYFNNTININDNMPPPPPNVIGGSSGMMEGMHQGPAGPSIHPQYAMDQNGNYVYVQPQSFPINPMSPSSNNLYEEKISEGNTPNE